MHHNCFVVFVSENMSTLFRGSTLSTMLMDQLMKLTASDYLLSVLKGPVQQILDSQESCEVYLGREVGWVGGGVAALLACT